MSKPKNKQSKEVTKPFTKEQVHDFVRNYLSVEGEESTLVKKMAQELLPKMSTTNNRDALSAEISEVGRDLMRIRETEYHCNVMEALPVQYRSMVTRMNKQIATEYDCQTELEKSLVSTVVHTYIRYIDNSRRLNNELACENITRNRNVYIANLSKQVDRVHRQYLSAIQQLKFIKAPSLSMNVKVGSAFIASEQNITIPIEHDSNTTK